METQTANSKSPATTNPQKKTDSSANAKISKAMKLVNEARTQKVSETKEEISTRIEELRMQLAEYQDQIMEQLEMARSKATTEIKRRPMSYVLGAGAIGLVLGFIFSRRK